MKLSRNYLIAALVLVILYMLFMRPQASSFCWPNPCTLWLPVGTKNPNPKFYKSAPIKNSLDKTKVAYCKC